MTPKDAVGREFMSGTTFCALGQTVFDNYPKARGDSAAIADLAHKLWLWIDPAYESAPEAWSYKIFGSDLRPRSPIHLARKIERLIQTGVVR